MHAGAGRIAMRVTVQSSIEIDATPERVWSLLCDARLPLSAPWCFRLGVPTPKSCRLVSDAGRVGSTRQCQTARGVINQRITAWVPPTELAFAMESTTLGLERHIAAMNDRFEIRSGTAGCRLSRITVLETRGSFAAVKAIAFRLSLGRIHRFVMRNFKALAEAAA
jgi:hypothetical protein